ncbi:MAG: PHP-associated domain-containing protein [Candidatus Woesearchaeota archaeon]|nr:PHP-associated domain-containing protein [Candidatus Woesearchaeota archaeon]
MLLADLHLHCKGDALDSIKYSPEELIDHAVLRGYEVLAITCHDIVIYSSKLAQYAKHKGILLIPGAEKTLNGKHILLYNITNKELVAIKTFEDIAKWKKRKKNALVIAPHPYYFLPFCLGKLTEQHIKLFDAIEYTHFYTTYFNLNSRAVILAKKHLKPLVGSSDTNSLCQFGTTRTLINSKKSIDAVITAIKQGKTQVSSRPLTTIEFIKTAILAMWSFGVLLLSSSSRT